MNEISNEAYPEAIKPVIAVLEQSNVEFIVKTYPSSAKAPVRQPS